ncbi:hypothetical protein B0T16DRAFT_23612 [Cercophora newfieldiana]|uniref:Uncharacterized protein n=1 Tax=Cercophora newfieldiana TaxID=92897 RepID=A0AA40CYC7_9PEZI|nr:hypothetical protein B0T16DRAFT_23612 [Cercophora newfieldiana]
MPRVNTARSTCEFQHQERSVSTRDNSKRKRKEGESATVSRHREEKSSDDSREGTVGSHRSCQRKRVKGREKKQTRNEGRSRHRQLRALRGGIVPSQGVLGRWKATEEEGMGPGLSPVKPRTTHGLPANPPVRARVLGQNAGAPIELRDSATAWMEKAQLLAGDSQVPDESRFR